MRPLSLLETTGHRERHISAKLHKLLLWRAQKQDCHKEESTKCFWASKDLTLALDSPTSSSIAWPMLESVFLDDEELCVGERIDGSLLQAINNSMIYIPIFSRTYAASRWCLHELVQIIANTFKSEGKKEILPISSTWNLTMLSWKLHYIATPF